MQFSDAQISQWLADFLWPLMRIAAMVMAAPIFSTRQIPVRFRLLLAVFITLLVQPVLPTSPVVAVFSPDAMLIALQQIAIGVALLASGDHLFHPDVFGDRMPITTTLGFVFATDGMLIS